MLRKPIKFNRRLAPRPLRRFCPDYRVRSVSEIDPQELAQDGFKAALLDMDNTLLPWRGETVPEETRVWIESCTRAGLKLCLVSNARNRVRLKAMSEKLGVPFASGRLKPAREGFEHALRLVGASPSETVMIGDQIFTDVWGGNRMGIVTILVEPVHPREFIGTKFSRVAERVVMWFLRRAVEPSP
ncbi:MAG: YqeG family HAD IIIA-type phosphatase [Armatimonadetes bacterium]|nr:YqeG family HAD IIIA-type phosphatase [Armatimonadota bacterium]